MMPGLVQAELGHNNVPLFKSQRLSINIEAQSFKSTSNYSEEGQRQSLISNNEFQTYDMLIGVTYDFSDYWSFTTGIELAYGESYDNSFRRSTRRIRGLNFGVYRLVQLIPGIFLIGDAHYFLNITENKIDDDEVSIGDGVSWAQAGVWWVHEFPNFFLYKLYAGYRSRTDSYSGLLVYRFGPEIWLQRFGMGFSFAGYMTLVNDKSSPDDLSERQQINTFYNAGSLRYNAENPHLEEVGVWLSYEIETLSFIKLGVHQVLGVENTADGFGFLVELQTSFRVDDGGLSFPYFAKTTKRAKKRGNRALLRNLGPDPRDQSPSVTPIVPVD